MLYPTLRNTAAEHTKDAMRDALKRVQSGQFAREWMEEYEKGMPNLSEMRQAELQHPIEVVGRQVRALFKKSN